MDNSIYPLEEKSRVHTRSVNQRLAPIYKALADDPDGWEYEAKAGDCGDWKKIDPDKWWSLLTAEYQSRRDYFRLVRKTRMITVEIPVPERLSAVVPADICGLVYTNVSDCLETEKAIRKAMGGSDE